MPELTRIQFSPTRRIDNAVIVWFEPGPEVDLVVDPRAPLGLRLQPGSVKALYEFGLLGYTAPEYLEPTLRQWKGLLKPEGELYLVEHNMEYLSRAIAGGDLKLENFNKEFVRNLYFSPELLTKIMAKTGFSTDKMREWFTPASFTKEHYEFVLSCVNPKPIIL